MLLKLYKCCTLAIPKLVRMWSSRNIPALLVVVENSTFPLEGSLVVHHKPDMPLEYDFLSIFLLYFLR